jgi:hypothetical protein
MQWQGAHGLNERNELFSGNLRSRVLVAALGSRLQFSIWGRSILMIADRIS